MQDTESYPSDQQAQGPVFNEQTPNNVQNQQVEFYPSEYQNYKRDMIGAMPPPSINRFTNSL